MKDLNKKLRFLLDIQCFAESGDGGDDGAGAGGNDPQEPQMVPKTQFDRLSTELANLKKTLKAKQTDEEKFAQEQEEKNQKIKELEDFQRKSVLSTNLLKGGVGEKDVDSIADAFLEGDSEKIAKAFNTALKNIIKAKDDEIAQLKLNGIDKPSGGGNGGTEVNAESFAKMTLDERIALKLKDPELYKQLSGR